MPILLIDDLRGGLNVTDPPLAIGDTQCTVAQNVEWVESAVARRRLGLTEMTTTTLPAPPAWLGRFRPGSSNAEAQLWTNAAGNWYRQGAALGSGTSFTVVTGLQADVAGAVAPSGTNICGASFNGKFFLAFDSDVDRLHVYDPTLNKVRRTGLAAPTVKPAAQNSLGAGTYAAIARTYRTAWVVQSSGTVIRRSDLSAVSDSFTPDGAHDSAQVLLMASPPGEGETHWELYGSIDDANYYRLQTVDISLSSAYDSVATTDYPDYDLAEDTGTYSNLPSAKYVAVDDNRLVLAGSYETTAYASRLWWTPVLGSDGVGDDERYLSTTDTKHYLDLDHFGEGDIRGLVGPFNDCLYVFKEYSIYKLVRTGNLTSPYLPVEVSHVVGCIRHQTIAMGTDAAGNAALYFLSRQGPYRLGAAGLEYLGYPVEARWRASGLGAGTQHTLSYLDRHQVWFIFDEQCFVYDTRRGAWSEYTGMPARSTASEMYGPICSTTQSLYLRPHLVSIDDPATRTLIARDSAQYSDAGTTYGTETTTDVGESYQALVTTKPYRLGGALGNAGVTQVEVVAAAGGDVQVTLTRDFGLEERHLPVDLEPVGDEPYVIRHVEALELSSAATLQMTIGDAGVQDEAWAIESVALRFRPEEAR